MAPKPAWIFDRDQDWQSLCSFVEHPRPVPALGIVTGRRRQGKTFLLSALADVYGGFYFGADEATDADALRRLGESLARFSGIPVRFGTWDEAIGYMFSLAPDRPVPLVLDEFQFLARAHPALPSILQRHLDAGQSPASPPSHVRLLLCGSALSFMGKLLAGQAPLRGRASLELVVKPLGFREAARFWAAPGARTAVLLNAIVGGTPAYRRQLARDDVPAGPDDFDDWVCRCVLNPAVPLFREARYLFAEDIEAREPGLYQSVLSAIAEGNTTSGGIAGYAGRRSPDLAHPLNVLEDAGLVQRDLDAFRKGRPSYRIAEPLLAFYQAIMRPQWAALELGRSKAVWEASRARFLARIVGPHFEQLCREWLATADALSEPPAVTAAGVVPAATAGGQIQVDVAALGPAWPGEKRRLLCLGEAKWGKVLGLRHLDRLVRAATALDARGLDTSAVTFALFSGAGFDDDLRAAAGARPDVLLVGLDLLYG